MCSFGNNMRRSRDVSDKITWAEKLDQDSSQKQYIQGSHKQKHNTQPCFHGSQNLNSGVQNRGGGGEPYQAVT